MISESRTERTRRPRMCYRFQMGNALMGKNTKSFLPLLCNNDLVRSFLYARESLGGTRDEEFDNGSPGLGRACIYIPDHPAPHPSQLIFFLLLFFWRDAKRQKRRRFCWFFEKCGIEKLFK